MKRVVVEMDEKLHKEIKIKCFNTDVTMKDYVLNLIKKDLKKGEMSKDE